MSHCLQGVHIWQLVQDFFHQYFCNILGHELSTWKKNKQTCFVVKLRWDPCFSSYAKGYQWLSDLQPILIGGFKYFWNFHLYLGKTNPLWLIYFSNGLVETTNQEKPTKRERVTFEFLPFLLRFFVGESDACCWKVYHWSSLVHWKKHMTCCSRSTSCRLFFKKISSWWLQVSVIQNFLQHQFSSPPKGGLLLPWEEATFSWDFLGDKRPLLLDCKRRLLQTSRNQAQRIVETP